MVHYGIANPDIEDYASKYTLKEEALIQQLKQATFDHMPGARMLSDNTVATLLYILVASLKAERVIEIGTYTGYSALMMAKGLKAGGKLITLERSEPSYRFAQTYFTKSQYASQIISLLGDASVLIHTLDGPFDLAFIDADKPNYIHYYEQLLPKMKTGGLIVADNILWSGKVLTPEESKQAKALDQYNQYVANDSRVEQVILTVRDGLNICRKR